MKLSITLLIVLVTDCIAWSKNTDRTDNDLPMEQLSRIYQAMLLKSKRSRSRKIRGLSEHRISVPVVRHNCRHAVASMGLSLAEYMASPQSQDNFHFIPIIRR
uniref:Secreted protein n=1 Tax=Elaeophora elaphi TaxID=1147741 RepID=A0A0R3RI26_9BILA